MLAEQPRQTSHPCCRGGAGEAQGWRRGGAAEGMAAFRVPSVWGGPRASSTRRGAQTSLGPTEEPPLRACAQPDTRPVSPLVFCVCVCVTHGESQADPRDPRGEDAGRFASFYR